MLSRVGSAPAGPHCAFRRAAAVPVSSSRPLMRLSTAQASSRTQLQLQQQQQQQSQRQGATERLELAPSLSLLLLSACVQQPVAAWADEEAASSTVEAVTAAAGSTAAEVPAATSGNATWLSYVIVLAPILLYGIFNVYRDRVNPRIKFSDFLFIVAGVAVIANLVSILAFRVRLF